MTNKNIPTVLGTCIIVILSITVIFFVWKYENIQEELTGAFLDYSIVLPSSQNNESEQKEGFIEGNIYKNIHYEFQLTLPYGWIDARERVLESSENRNYNIRFTVMNITEIQDDASRILLEQGKLNEYETVHFKAMCGETDACGTVSGIKNLKNDTVKGIEFTVTYPGIRIDEPRGTITEVHQTFIRDGRIYSFWASEKNPPKELLAEYPELNPSPLEVFHDILSTLIFTSNPDAICNEAECVTFTKSGELHGSAVIEGFYTKTTHRDEDFGDEVCNEFVITGGSKIVSDYFVKMVESGNTVNRKDSEGRPAINVNINELSSSDRKKLLDSTASKPLSLAVEIPEQAGTDAPSCFSFVVLKSIK